jgi:hypothetical protein
MCPAVKTNIVVAATYPLIHCVENRFLFIRSNGVLTPSFLLRICDATMNVWLYTSHHFHFVVVTLFSLIQSLLLGATIIGPGDKLSGWRKT